MSSSARGFPKRFTLALFFAETITSLQFEQKKKHCRRGENDVLLQEECFSIHDSISH